MINLILLVIGFIILGRDFGVKTAYVTVVSSLLLNVFEKVFPMDRALTGNIMLELCFAIILPALAAALLFDDENRKAESVMFRNEFVSALEDAAPAVPDYGEE